MLVRQSFQGVYDVQANVGVRSASVFRVLKVGKSHYMPPPIPPSGAALVGENGEEPRPETYRVGPKVPNIPPRLQCSLLYRILCGFTVAQHRKRQSIRRFPQRIKKEGKCRSITAPGTRKKIAARH